MILTSQDWNKLDTLNLSPKILDELKQLKEKTVDLEAEFYNIFLKEMNINMSLGQGKNNVLLNTGLDFLGREWGRNLGALTGNQIAKDIFCQESNKIIAEKANKEEN